MAAPERFAEMSDFSLAPQAPSIHGTKRHSSRRTIFGRSWGKSGQISILVSHGNDVNDPSRTWTPFPSISTAARTTWNTGTIQTLHLSFQPVEKMPTIYANSGFQPGNP